MKVMHIASGDLWAGAEKQLYTLLVALKNRGDVQLCAVILNPGTLAQRIRQAGIPVLALDESRQSSASLARDIDRFIRAERPDIIHTHRSKENILGGLLAWRRGIPSLRTQHGDSEHGDKRLQPRQLVLRLADLGVGRFLQRKVVAVSDPLGQALAQRFTPARVAVIHNGLDCAPDDDPQPRQTLTDPISIGIVGRLAPVKRVDLFLRIARRVRDLPGLPQPRFLVIGDGPLRDELLALRETLGLKDDVAMVGHVDNAEEAIAQLDVLIICSDHEGLPMVSLEAMKHRTLVLTHPIGGLVQLLDGGACGVLADAQSVEAFAQAISAIIADKAASRRRIALAHQRFERCYSAAGMAQQYLQLYQSLCR